MTRRTWLGRWRSRSYRLLSLLCIDVLGYLGMERRGEKAQAGTMASYGFSYFRMVRNTCGLGTTVGDMCMYQVTRCNETIQLKLRLACFENYLSDRLYIGRVLTWVAEPYHVSTTGAVNRPETSTRETRERTFDGFTPFIPVPLLCTYQELHHTPHRCSL